MGGGSSLPVTASVEDVQDSVKRLGSSYSAYLPMIDAHGLDGELVASLGKESEATVLETLSELGVTSLLHRKKLSRAVRRTSLGVDATDAAAVGAPVLESPAGALWHVMLTWEGDVDLDLAAAIYGHNGTFLDLVYYANTETAGRGCTHSGDNKGGDAACSETVSVRPAMLDARSMAVVFFVRCHDAESAIGSTLHPAVLISNEATSSRGAVVELSLADHKQATTVAVGRLYRRGGAKWIFDKLDCPFVVGHELSSVVPRCLSLLRDVIVPMSANPDCSVVVLDKGGLMPIEGTSVSLGLGWDPVEGNANAGHLDLDAGAVLLDDSNMYIDFVYFANLSTPGCSHTGDNRTGEGEGDDERIVFHLNELPPNVHSIVVAVSAFNGDFESVKGGFCRLMDDAQGGREIMRWALSGQFKETSVLVCKIFRDAGFFKLFVLGEPIGGRSIVEFFYTDTFGEMAELRARFKVAARADYSDAAFFKLCEERRLLGAAPAQVDKTDVFAHDGTPPPSASAVGPH